MRFLTPNIQATNLHLKYIQKAVLNLSNLFFSYCYINLYIHSYVNYDKHRITNQLWY